MKYSEFERGRVRALFGIDAIWECSQCNKPIPALQLDVPIEYGPRDPITSGFLGRKVTEVICQTCDNANRGVETAIVCMPSFDPKHASMKQVMAGVKRHRRSARGRGKTIYESKKLVKTCIALFEKAKKEPMTTDIVTSKVRYKMRKSGERITQKAVKSVLTGLRREKVIARKSGRWSLRSA